MSSVQVYGRNVVLQLLSHIDSLEWESKALVKTSEEMVNSYERGIKKREDLYEKALADIGKHGMTIMEQSNEIERLREGKKVVLPKEVAEAIGYYRNNWSSNETILRAIIDQLPGHNATLLRKFSAINFDKLLQALVNDFTVEESSPEERFKTSLQDLIGSWEGKGIDLVREVDVFFKEYQS